MSVIGRTPTGYKLYFNPYNLDDALLRTYVTPAIIDESSQYVESIALGLGVSAKDIYIDATTGLPPYMIQRLARIFSYMTAAYRKATFAKGGNVDNDSFALKYRIYKALLDDLLSSITGDTFTNGISAKKRKFPAIIGMSRN